MIQASRNRFSLWFYTSYFRLLQGIFFRKVEHRFLNDVPDGPVLLLQNHFSWWDGYWSYVISEKILKRKFHVMMLEKELRKRRFLARTGAFSVDPEGKDLLKGLRYAARLLQDPDNAVTVYPQGKLVSHYTNRIGFERGTELLLKLSAREVNVVFAAVNVEFGAPVRPKVIVNLTFYGKGVYSAESLQDAYNTFYVHTRSQIIASDG